ncbi:hypothetical protein [Paraglaciecola sp.]|uniref:hypothetical protein n=1 Tax=Paraglaciecola sp. TaxID=1920173 RepID=UPI003266D46B
MPSILKRIFMLCTSNDYWKKQISEAIYPIAERNNQRIKSLTQLNIDSHTVFRRAVESNLKCSQLDFIELDKLDVEACKRLLSKGGYRSEWLDELSKSKNEKYAQSKDILDLSKTELHRRLKSWDMQSTPAFLSWIDIVQSRYQLKFKERASEFNKQHSISDNKKYIRDWIKFHVFPDCEFAFCRKRSSGKRLVFSKELNHELDILFAFFDDTGLGYTGHGVESYLVIIKKNCKKFRIDLPSPDFVEYPLYLFFGELPPPFGRPYSYYVEKNDLNYLFFIHATMFKLMLDDLQFNLSNL